MLSDLLKGCLQVKHSSCGFPAVFGGQLQIGMWLLVWQIAFRPHGWESQGSRHWCSIQALLSGHSSSYWHSPILTNRERDNKKWGHIKVKSIWTVHLVLCCWIMTFPLYRNKGNYKRTLQGASKCENCLTWDTSLVWIPLESRRTVTGGTMPLWCTDSRRAAWVVGITGVGAVSIVASFRV